MKVYIDPGHKGSKYNKTTTGLDYYESAMTWKLSGYLKSELEKLGATATLSRNTIDSNPSLYSRGYGAKGYDLFLSIHSNACGTESVDYPVVYRGYDKTKAEDFAMKLSNLIRDTMGCKQAAKTATRKGSVSEYYGVMRGARAAGLTYYYIVEHSFHTNKAATQWLMSDDNLKLLAKAEAKFIVDYFKSQTSSTTSTTTPSSSTYTKTQFIKDVQSAIGAKVDGIAGNETLSKTITVSKSKNSKHAVVLPIQKYLNALGFNCGTADGIAGSKFDSAVKAYQKANGCVSDGEITAQKNTWKKLLGLL